MTLPQQARDWVRRITGSPVLAAEPLPGASSASVYRLTMEDGPDLVIKRFDRDDPLDVRPDWAAHEAAVLELLAASAVRVPRLVGCDRAGKETGVPAVLMSHVRGSADLPDRWHAPAAAVVASIGTVTPGALDWLYERYNEGLQPIVPCWATDRGLWKSAFDLVASEPPDSSWGFIHRDLHPGNLVWQGGHVNAVLDWLSGCIGPLAIDPAHFRANLAMDLGSEAGDAFLVAYLRRVHPDTWHPYWAIVDAVDFLPFWESQEAVDRWRWDRRPAALTRSRFEDHLRSGLFAVGV